MRRLLAVVGVVVLVGVAFVVADRLVQATVEQRATEALPTSGLALSDDATVSLGGFPFLTQLATGRLRDASLTASSVEVDGVVLTDVVATASGVTTAAPHVAESVALTATAPESTLTDAVEQSRLGQLGVDVTITVEAGEIVATTSLLGLPVVVVMAPEAAGDAIGVGIEEVRIAGFTVTVDDLPQAVRTALDQVRVPLEGLPAGLSVTEVEVVEDGLRLTATGTDVQVEAAVPVGATVP